MERPGIACLLSESFLPKVTAMGARIHITKPAVASAPRAGDQAVVAARTGALAAFDEPLDFGLSKVLACSDLGIIWAGAV